MRSKANRTDAMDLDDEQGQMPALQDATDCAVHRQERLTGVVLDDCVGVLERFLCGLNGRPLRIAVAEQVYTDTETLFLPPVIDRLADRASNFRLYKAMAVHLWAQSWYGTWRGGWLIEASDQGRLAAGELARLHALETRRLDACLQRDFPGLHRDMLGLRGELDDQPDLWCAPADALRQPSATVRDSLRLLDVCRGAPPVCCYAGVLQPAAVGARMRRRVAQERDDFRVALARLVEDQDGRSPAAGERDAETLQERRERLAVRRKEDLAGVNGVGYDLLLDGRAIAPPADRVSIMERIIQDQGEIPPDDLIAAGPGLYRPRPAEPARDPRAVRAGTDREDGAFLYDEWDFSRQHHRKGWCVLREHEVEPDDPDFYPQTLGRYAGLIKSVRRTFEVLRGEDRRLKRQQDGEDVDIDALVDAYADVRAGLEMSDRLFTRSHRDERDIAVALMVDMSGSTRGWINCAEREALILLAEALDTLGERFAIYGFSGWGRKRCEVYAVKRFDAPYDDATKARICGIAPRDYTRMGAPIRHLTRLLAEQVARTRLLITLSDGKPDDYDLQYRGAYGIEDTRQALFEARLAGIHPFCITIDAEGADYLPHLYGSANYTVIADVASLPLKVSDIYRRLTA
ncbi:nitric oxide reductase activation protein NorD [Thiocystis violacea]|uniref:nitric oxide reductase activation protein NorD n=1 Tax=Thiocystis violacea TaxID=13725 RepID=UPI001908DD91|nr:hypothetical protein [Thiocystis violacea]MBK1721458.1 hypothetical protein [Thiocystis violacea]